MEHYAINYSYTEKLEKLGLTTLLERRIDGLVWFGLVWFYGISTIVGNLTSIFYTYTWCLQ